MKNRKRALADEKKQLNKDLKVEERRRKRWLTKAAKNLSDAELLSVVAARHAAAKAKGKGKAFGKGKPSGKGK